MNDDVSMICGECGGAPGDPGWFDDLQEPDFAHKCRAQFHDEAKWKALVLLVRTSEARNQWLEAAVARIAELEKDRERLDWLMSEEGWSRAGIDGSKKEATK